MLKIHSGSVINFIKSSSSLSSRYPLVFPPPPPSLWAHDRKPIDASLVCSSSSNFLAHSELVCSSAVSRGVCVCVSEMGTSSGFVFSWWVMCVSSLTAAFVPNTNSETSTFTALASIVIYSTTSHKSRPLQFTGSVFIHQSLCCVLILFTWLFENIFPPAVDEDAVVEYENRTLKMKKN